MVCNIKNTYTLTHTTRCYPITPGSAHCRKGAYFPKIIPGVKKLNNKTNQNFSIVVYTCEKFPTALRLEGCMEIRPVHRGPTKETSQSRLTLWQHAIWSDAIADSLFSDMFVANAESKSPNRPISVRNCDFLLLFILPTLLLCWSF